MNPEQLEVDVLIVGAGPAGLAAAIRLKQLQPQAQILVLEKAVAVGAHLLSGALLDPIALNELLPDWQAHDAPLDTAVTQSQLQILSAKRHWQMPHFLLPDDFRNDDAYVISLGSFARWLATQAETLGVDIFPGFVAADALFGAQGELAGVITGAFGLDRQAQPLPGYRPGMEIRARYTLLAEGSRGHLGKCLEKHYALRTGKAPQVYSLGIKELWEAPETSHAPGYALHTVGWPLRNQAAGGGFCYHMTGENQRRLIAVGLIAGLGYRNPWFSPVAEFQRYKQHPLIQAQLQGARRIGYGARTLATGGLSALPRLSFPGGALIGEDAGFMITSRQKGIHSAMKSGMLAAEAVAEALATNRGNDELSTYPQRVQHSWLFDELRRSRNFKSWQDRGWLLGGALACTELSLLGKRAPWTLRSAPDHAKLKPAKEAERLDYPAADGMISFDIPSSLQLSGTQHTENQPCHLHLHDADIPLRLNLEKYAAPELRYCPAQVYEIIEADDRPQLLIHAANCLHCKACDIKDPQQNIDWTPPQGGEGPRYREM